MRIYSREEKRKAPSREFLGLLGGFSGKCPYSTVSFQLLPWAVLFTGRSSGKPHFFMKKDRSLKESRERSETALAPLLLLDHRRSSAEPPKGSTFSRTTTRRPDVLPNHHLKTRRPAVPPSEARRSAGLPLKA
ncbi:hypothetical protein M5K25_007304 [Dendrobium thyrsiflorum]|uniref:Uncharacterized protein n=1 Tax=Dendrobium thyrsiflorum TaxID=117978 RepID=A0ABD0VEX1_DENTH